MIRLTRLNNSPLAVNSDLIKFVESAPDTVITLSTGEKVVVLESWDEIIARIIEFRRAVMSQAPFRAGGPVVVPAVPEPGTLKPAIVRTPGEEDHG